VVVVGAGFGGLSAVKGLRGRPVRVVLVDRHNYHLFTPLLYQVASSLLDPSEIAHPVRAMLRGAPNVRVQLGEVRSIDPAARQVEVDDACIGYDYLVLAAGSVNDYFGHDELGARTYGLKDLDQALSLRYRVLEQFERAAATPDRDLRRRLMTFAVVGAGPPAWSTRAPFRSSSAWFCARTFPSSTWAGSGSSSSKAPQRYWGPFTPAFVGLRPEPWNPKASR
jgi:NADH dehydrogenase